MTDNQKKALIFLRKALKKGRQLKPNTFEIGQAIALLKPPSQESQCKRCTKATVDNTEYCQEHLDYINGYDESLFEPASQEPDDAEFVEKAREWAENWDGTYKEYIEKYNQLCDRLEAAKQENEMFWEDLLRKLQDVWPDKKLIYGLSPLELIADLAEERDQLQAKLEALKD